MNKEQLDAIKARVAKATAGEWATIYRFNVITLDKNSQEVNTAFLEADNVIATTTDGEFIQTQNAENDADFIAHARQDVPALIAEVERLQKVLKNTDADLYVYKDLYDEMTDKNVELIKFLQTRITKGWGQKAVDLAMIHIQEQEKEVERLQKANRERVEIIEEQNKELNKFRMDKSLMDFGISTERVRVVEKEKIPNQAFRNRKRQVKHLTRGCIRRNAEIRRLREALLMVINECDETLENYVEDSATVSIRDTAQRALEVEQNE